MFSDNKLIKIPVNLTVKISEKKGIFESRKRSIIQSDQTKKEETVRERAKKIYNKPDQMGKENSNLPSKNTNKKQVFMPKA